MDNTRPILRFKKVPTTLNLLVLNEMLVLNITLLEIPVETFKLSKGLGSNTLMRSYKIEGRHRKSGITKHYEKFRHQTVFLTKISVTIFRDVLWIKNIKPHKLIKQIVVKTE